MSVKQKSIRLKLDIFKNKINQEQPFDLSTFQELQKKKTAPVFFSKKGIIQDFITQDSGLYFSSEKLRELKKIGRISRSKNILDSISSRNFQKSRVYTIGKADLVTLRIRRRYSKFNNYLADLINGAAQGVSLAKAWNLSVVGAVIFGMFTMTMIYRYLGQNVSAEMKNSTGNSEMANKIEENDSNINDEIDIAYITKILENEIGEEKISKKEFEKEILSMVKGYPIEKMVPDIVKQDRIVAAFLVAIAKKESNWGKRVPVLDGQDCYNYWGYRGIRDRMGTGGHTCFDSTKDAVETVGKRIEYLVSDTKRNTPGKMVVWKCGYDCSWDSKTAVQKWISDVDLYFKKLNRE